MCTTLTEQGLESGPHGAWGRHSSEFLEVCMTEEGAVHAQKVIGKILQQSVPVNVKTPVQEFKYRRRPAWVGETMLRRHNYSLKFHY